jgi:DNA-binding transcriptional ArsR family regulator
MGATVQVIQSATAAEQLLKPDRLRMLELLAEPGSAASLAKHLKLPRQTVNYHLHELEKAGLVEFVEQRPKGNCLERVVRAAARSYVISPQALGTLGSGGGQVRDQFSAAYLVTAAARVIREVTILRQRAKKAGKKIATLTAETEIRFADAEARGRFAEELVNEIARLTLKYHDETAEAGRSFRWLVGGYPCAAKPEPIDETSVPLE